MMKRKRLVIAPPPGLEPELAKIIEALACKAAHDDYCGGKIENAAIGETDVKTRRALRPVFKRSAD